MRPRVFMTSTDHFEEGNAFSDNKGDTSTDSRYKRKGNFFNANYATISGDLVISPYSSINCIKILCPIMSKIDHSAPHLAFEEIKYLL